MNWGHSDGQSCLRICEARGEVSQRLLLKLKGRESRAHLNEDEVELVEVDLLSPHPDLVRRRFDDHTDDEVTDACVKEASKLRLDESEEMEVQRRREGKSELETYLLAARPAELSIASG